MARKASSKSESSNSTATNGIENGGQPNSTTSPAKSKPQGERGGVHPFGVPPNPAKRDSAFLERGASPQVVLRSREANEARDNNANFAWVQHFIHHLASQGMADFVLANPLP